MYPDLAFFLNESNTTESKKYLLAKGVPLGKEKCIGITVRPYRFPKSKNPVRKYESYIRAIAKFCQWAENNGYHIVLFAHTLGPGNHENDKIALGTLLDKTTLKNYIFIDDKNLSCRNLKSLYGHLDYLIGTRFHSVVFALSMGVPSLAISYGGNKSQGIMFDISLSGYVIPIEDISFEVTKKKFLSLVNNENIIKNAILDYKKYLLVKRKELINLVKKEITSKL